MNALWVGMLSATPNLRQLENLTERFWGRISDSTLHGLLVRLEAAPLRRLLVAEVRRAWRAKELDSEMGLNVVAVDGKCVWTGRHKANRFCQRQSQQADRNRYTMKVLRAMLVSSRCKLLLGQRPIHARSAEMSTFAGFFRQLLADYGRAGLLDVISVDAGMVSRANAELIHGEGRAYIMALKSPQWELVLEARRQLGRRRKPDAQTPWERYRGGRVRRLLFRTTEMAGYHGWAHLQQVWRVRQETERSDGRVRVEERYFLTSLSSGQTRAGRPLQLVRAHWALGEPSAGGGQPAEAAGLQRGGAPASPQATERRQPDTHLAQPHRDDLRRAGAGGQPLDRSAPCSRAVRRSSRLTTASTPRRPEKPDLPLCCESVQRPHTCVRNALEPGAMSSAPQSPSPVGPTRIKCGLRPRPGQRRLVEAATYQAAHGGTGGDARSAPPPPHRTLSASLAGAVSV
jgi:hypothetical protein